MIIRKSAVIVDQWRYRLDRIWEPHKGVCTFVMLNPSTADAEQDDATIRRCVGYTRDWGLGHLVVVNLYAYRATHPRDLKRKIAEDMADAIGPDTGRHVVDALREATVVVAAWGAHAPNRQVEAMRATFQALRLPRVNCLGLTRSGAPVHPLRQPKDAPLLAYYTP